MIALESHHLLVAIVENVNDRAVVVTEGIFWVVTEIEGHDLKEISNPNDFSVKEETVPLLDLGGTDIRPERTRRPRRVAKRRGLKSKAGLLF